MLVACCFCIVMVKSQKITLSVILILKAKVRKVKKVRKDKKDKPNQDNKKACQKTGSERKKSCCQRNLKRWEILKQESKESNQKIKLSLYHVSCQYLHCGTFWRGIE